MGSAGLSCRAGHRWETIAFCPGASHARAAQGGRAAGLCRVPGAAGQCTGTGICLPGPHPCPSLGLLEAPGEHQGLTSLEGTDTLAKHQFDCLYNKHRCLQIRHQCSVPLLAEEGPLTHTEGPQSPPAAVKHPRAYPQAAMTLEQSAEDLKTEGRSMGSVDKGQESTGCGVSPQPLQRRQAAASRYRRYCIPLPMPCSSVAAFPGELRCHHCHKPGSSHGTGTSQRWEVQARSTDLLLITHLPPASQKLPALRP